MQNHYCYTIDTAKSNSINTYPNNGSIINFKSTEYNHLYAHHFTGNNSINAVLNFFADVSDPLFLPTVLENNYFEIDTVTKKADKYTKRQVKAALQARSLENIIMCPGNRKYTDICLPHFDKDCPVTIQDIKAANDILGKNLGALKGKTASKKQAHTKTNILLVPSDILKIHKQVTLCVDLMFVNKVPFLIIVSQCLWFGTVKALPDCKLTTIVSKLRTVINTYHYCSFNITSILSDGEFELIRPWFPVLNTYAENEYVPDIERFIRTIKDSTRSTHMMLPFSRVPKILLIHLVKNAVFWFNPFLSTDRVSSRHSLCHFLVGFEVSYSKHTVMQFGSYIQTHEDYSNGVSQ